MTEPLKPIRAAYEAALLRRGYQSDPSQLAAVARLDQLASEFAEFKEQRSNVFKRLINRPEVPRGIWLWGGVGRGKSFVMDLFFDTIAVKRKRRTHFHEFMRAIHRDLDDLKGQADPLDILAERTAEEVRLLCFDEFHLSDVASAMILERLLRGLFKHGVCLVTTSNYEPSRLYPNGLHRERILPAIALLEKELDIVQIDSGQDYRRRSLTQAQVYLESNDAAAIAVLTQHFERLAERADDDPCITIESRVLTARRRAGGVIWFDFAHLCGGPRSQNDYLEISQQFHTVILSGVPIMGAGQASEARRFTWLVDVLYDRGVKLIIAADGPPEKLYVQGMLANEFHRTVSRLLEMRTEEYLAAPRRHLAPH